ncbi:MAG: head GIN domain-containing protein [Candidatus Altiarchaeia archaeon]|jgi:carbon monoxide dehydrogenase subunit G
MEIEEYLIYYVSYLLTMERKINICLLLGILILTLSLGGCVGSCVQGSGNKIAQERVVPPFTGVSFSGEGNVNIIQDGSAKVKLTGDDNILENVETYVQDDVLYIRPKQCYSGSIDAYVNMGTVRSISLDGSGNIIGGTKITSDDLLLKLSGSGKIMAGMEAKKLAVSVSGSGESTLIGTADDFSYDLSGSGKLSAYKLSAKRGKITISGSGSAETTARETLDVTISGSGTVYYKGNATVSQTVSGSGKIVKTE